MKSKILLISIVSILILLGCGTTHRNTKKIIAVASPEQEVGYKETVTSQKKHFVSLAPYQEDRQDLLFQYYLISQIGPYKSLMSSSFTWPLTSFILFVKNCGEDPINISSHNISVIFEGKTEKQTPMEIKVLSYQDLIREMSLIEWSTEHETAEDIRSYWEERKYRENYDMQSRMLNGYYVNYDSRMSDDLNNLDNRLALMESKRQLIETLVLKPQTLMPGESSGGLVVCGTHNMNDKVEGNFKVAVSVNGEDHEFTFNRSLISSRQ